MVSGDDLDARRQKDIVAHRDAVAGEQHAERVDPAVSSDHDVARSTHTSNQSERFDVRSRSDDDPGTANRRKDAGVGAYDCALGYHEGRAHRCPSLATVINPPLIPSRS